MSTSSQAWLIGQQVILKQAHPCGSRCWIIFRLGMEVGLQCQQCGRRIKLAQRRFAHAVDHDATR